LGPADDHDSERLNGRDAMTRLLPWLSPALSDSGYGRADERGSCGLVRPRSDGGTTAGAPPSTDNDQGAPICSCIRRKVTIPGPTCWKSTLLPFGATRTGLVQSALPAAGSAVVMLSLRDSRSR
jgi:hypothetical protein